MTTGTDDICGTVSVAGEARFICVAAPHDDHPTSHYFRRANHIVSTPPKSYAATTASVPSNAHLESALEAFFRNRVRLAGGIALKMAPTVTGIPDRIVIMPGGRVFFVELKTEKGVVSAVQKMWHERLSSKGARVVVLYGKAEIEGWVRVIVEQSGPRFRRTRGDFHSVK
jgi:hypothetical protein